MADFSKVQSRELRKIIRRLPAVSTLKGAECFLLKYVGFEAVIRKIWHYYRCRKKHKTESRAPIPLPELVKSMEYFQIDISDDVLHTLLDSSLDKRKFKSARNLRNGIVHAWKIEDCDEAKGRLNEFCKHFYTVLSQVDISLKKKVSG
ncbi:MAG: hypothetical protein AB9Q20_13950 [Candidatus Reddybacter sp.]